MPATAGQPPRNRGWIFSVVENQQPPAPFTQLSQHRCPDQFCTRPGPQASQRNTQCCELVPDQPRLLGIDPPR